MLEQNVPYAKHTECHYNQHAPGVRVDVWECVLECDNTG